MHDLAVLYLGDDYIRRGWRARDYTELFLLK